MKLFRRIAIAILAVLTLAGVCVAAAACNHDNEPCMHYITEYVAVDDMLHQEVCLDCESVLGQEPHSYCIVDEDGGFRIPDDEPTVLHCAVCGHEFFVEGIGPDTPTYPSMFSYGGIIRDGVETVSVEVNLYYATKGVAEIPSVLPPDKVDRWQSWAEEDGNRFVNKVTDVTIVCHDLDEGPGEMCSALYLPDGVEHVNVILYTSVVEANGTSKTEIEWFKSLCTHDESGYYLGTADNDYYAFIIPECVEELNVHAGTKIIVDDALSDSQYYEPNAPYTVKKITLPEGLTRLPDKGFYGMEALREVNIPDGITYIPESCFYNTQVTSLILPDSVVEIGDKAFVLSPLHTLVLPDSVTTLGEQLFLYNDNGQVTCPLRYLELGSGITELPASSFGNMLEILELCNRSQVALTNNSLAEDEGRYINAHRIITDPADTKIFTDNGYTYFDDNGTILCVDGPEGATTLTLPADYNGGSYKVTPLFGGFADVTDLTVPTSVGSWDLRHPGTTGIYYSQICVPEKITGSWAIVKAFNNDDLSYDPIAGGLVYKCTREVVLQGDIAFGENDSGIELKKVTIDASVSKITVPSSFDYSYRYAVMGAEDLYVVPGALLECDPRVFGYISVTNSLKADSYVVACKVLNSYEYSDPIPLVEIVSCLDPDGYTLPVSGSSYHVCDITELVVSEGVTALPDGLFGHGGGGEKWLESVTLPQSLRRIPTGLVNGGNFEEIELPADLTEIGEKAFYYCSELKSLTLPTGLKSIGSKAFYGCIMLDSVSLPAGLERIDSEAFYACNSLTSVELPDGLSYLGGWVFNMPDFGEREDGVIYLGKYAIGLDGTQQEVALRAGTEKFFDYSYRNDNTMSTIYTSITSIELPASLEYWASLEDRSEDYRVDYSKLQQIIVNGANEHFSALDGLLYNKAETELLYVPYNFDPERVIFPDTLEHIGKDVFADTSAYSEHSRAGTDLVVDGWIVYLAQGDQDIVELDPSKNYADGIMDSLTRFSYQGSIYSRTDGKLTLESVTDKNVYFVSIMDGTYAVASNAFADMPNLYGVYFPASVQRLQNGVFGNRASAVNRYFEGDIPAGSDRYDDSTNGGDDFKVDGGEFTHVTIDPTTSNIYAYVDDAHNLVADASTLYMLCGNASMHPTTGNGQTTHVTVPDMYDGKVVYGIADYAFIGNPVHWLTLNAEGDHVKFIGDYAFQDSNMSTMTVTNVGYIGEHAFYKAKFSNGRDITFGYNREDLGDEFALQIEDGAFAFNSALDAIQLGTANVVFGSKPFEGCTSLYYVYTSTGEVAPNKSYTWYTVTLDMSSHSVNVKQVQLTATELAQALKSNDMPYAFIDPTSLM